MQLQPGALFSWTVFKTMEVKLDIHPFIVFCLSFMWNEREYFFNGELKHERALIKL